MAFDPEAIQAALFARLSTIAGLGAIKTRRIRSFSQVSTTSMPALVLEALRGNFDGDNEPARSGTLRAMGIFFVKAPSDETQTPETQLFALWSAARAALQVQPGERQPDPGNGTTLGRDDVFACVIRDYELHQIEGSVAALSFTVEIACAE